MATATATGLPRSTTNRVLFRTLVILVLLPVLAAVGVAGWFLGMAHAALPQLDGRLTLPGLSQPVTVRRDAQGVPHIVAANLHDLFEAEGYVTAQDRLWQLDITRRYARGELAEVLGDSVVKLDRRQRIFGLRHTAEQVVEHLTTEQRESGEAYAQGVNAYIAQHTHRLPMEFRLLRYQPREWTLVDTYALGLNMAENLSARFDAQVSKEKVVAKLGAQLAADLYPVSSWRDRIPGEDMVAIEQEEEQQPADPEDEDDQEMDPDRDPSVTQLPAADREMLRGLLHGELAPGSNEWVVGGEHTITGRPLLSNDMHLPHSQPGIWYEVHLTAGDFDVAGVALPGNPYVIAGHNRRIAWGFTVLPAAVHDLFVENFNAGGQYETPEGWKKPEHRREVIQVKGAPDEVLDVVVTRHGPVVTPLLAGESRQLALQWTILDAPRVAFPFDELDRAGDWEQFRQALSKMTLPVLNVVYGDVDGHIGYQAAGDIPVRKQGDGSLPQAGNDGRHDWTGTIPFEALPRVYDPPSGILATANNRTTPEGYKYFVTDAWFPPYRAERIYRVLMSGRKFSPGDMLDLQTDIYSDFDHFCADRFAAAVEHARNPSPRAKQAAELMRRWDGRMTTESAAAAVEVLSRIELRRLLFGQRLGDVPTDPHNATRVPDVNAVAMEEILKKEPRRWLPEKYAGYDEVLSAAVENVVSAPNAPKDLTHWRYGRLFPLVLNHPVFERVPLLRRWSGPGTREQSGGSYTIKQVGPGFGPSERMTVDLADLDRSTLNVVTGESGQIFSPYSMDQWPAWYEGRTYLLAFSERAVEQATRHRLTLEPGR